MQPPPCKRSVCILRVDAALHHVESLRDGRAREGHRVAIPVATICPHCLLQVAAVDGLVLALEDWEDQVIAIGYSIDDEMNKDFLLLSTV